MRRATISLGVLLVILTAVTPGLAQRNSVGLRLGLTQTRFGGDLAETLDLGGRGGFIAGAAAQFRFGPIFGFQPELLYVVKGGGTEEVDLDIDVSVKYVALQIPLVVMIPVAGSLQPRIYAGPSVAWEQSCQLALEDPEVKLTFDCDQELDLPDFGTVVVFTETKSPDVGLVFGGGLDVRAGPGAVTFDVRYELGFTDINNLPGQSPSLFNRAIEMLVGYSVYFGSPLQEDGPAR